VPEPPAVESAAVEPPAVEVEVNASPVGTQHSVEHAPDVSGGAGQLALASGIVPSGQDCAEAGPAPASVHATVRAELDAKDFDVTISDGTPAFRRCLTENLHKRLRDAFTIRRVEDPAPGNEYFRIDADADADWTTDVESPEARAARHERDRKRAEADDDVVY
jgi:hypothetical protein